MARSIKPGLLIVFYCLNFAILSCLLSAAFFLAQGLFVDLYACNEKAVGQVQFVYDTSSWAAADFCMVDLNYTANKDTTNEQSFYAIQVALRCERMHNTDNKTFTTVCYNHYHPELFASATDQEILDAQSSHDEAVKFLSLGFKSALWMAFFAFISSAINRNLERLDTCAIQIQEHCASSWSKVRLKYKEWRQRRSQAPSLDVTTNSPGEAEMQRITSNNTSNSVDPQECV